VEHFKPPYYTSPNPLYFFDRWLLSCLSVESVGRLKIGLLEIHRDALRGHDEHKEPNVHVNWALRAYNVIATELFGAGVLTDNLVTKHIPEMVFDACITAYWIRSAIAGPEKSGTDVPFGQFWINPENLDWMFLDYLQPEMSIWLNRLDAPLRAEESRQPDDKRLPAPCRNSSHDDVQDKRFGRKPSKSGLNRPEPSLDCVGDFPCSGLADEAQFGTLSPETVLATVGPKSLFSVEAAETVRTYMQQQHWNIAEFAVQAQVAETTIRRFLKTGRLRRSCFDSVAKMMGLTRDQLFRGELPTATR
jgi:hypothetical protein